MEYRTMDDINEDFRIAFQNVKNGNITSELENFIYRLKQVRPELTDEEIQINMGYDPKVMEALEKDPDMPLRMAQSINKGMLDSLIKD